MATTKSNKLIKALDAGFEIIFMAHDQLGNILASNDPEYDNPDSDQKKYDLCAKFMKEYINIRRKLEK